MIHLNDGFYIASKSLYIGSPHARYSFFEIRDSVYWPIDNQLIEPKSIITGPFKSVKDIKNHLKDFQICPNASKL